MPFHVIKGTMHLVGKTKNGNPSGFEPDGDSIQFKPHDLKKLDLLQRLKSPYKPSSIKSVNLRLEGIDATELHVAGSKRQPSPFGENARDFLTGLFGMNPVTYATPNGIKVKPPANDGKDAYILSRALDVHGRPVSFLFVGKTSETDGKQVKLDTTRLKKSVNYKLIAEGHAYPLFYDTLFFDLRNALAAASDKARKANKNIWKRNVLKAFSVSSTVDAEAAQLLYPKLFRRLVDYFKNHSNLNNFVSWMNANHQNDELWTLSDLNHTHLDNVLKVTATTISLTTQPSKIVFVSRK